MHDHADLVFVDGTVLTVDTGFSVASALAVAGGTIVAVGTATRNPSHAGSAHRHRRRRA
jgi:predicted amidohydrolase YtcJ